jgi:ClpX C4-type zinc finger
MCNFCGRIEKETDSIWVRPIGNFSICFVCVKDLNDLLRVTPND